MKRFIIIALSSVSIVFMLSLIAPRQRAQQSPFSGAQGTGRARTDGFLNDALEVMPLTTLEAAKRSERIVLLKSKSNDVRHGVGGNIFTYTTFEVLRTIKGQLAGTDLTLRVLGGRIGDVEVTSPITVTFTPGERFVLFLGKDNFDGYPTLIPQAIFAVRTLQGVEVVEPTPTGLPLFHAKGNSVYARTPQYVPLEDFLFSLEKVR